MNNRKFFKKDIPPACIYCKSGHSISGGKEAFCLKKGIVAANDSCHSFKYDPLKRKPIIKDFSKNYSTTDFEV